MSDTTYESSERSVVTPGGFVSFPEEFRAAPADLRNVVKVLHRPALRKNALGLEFSSDAVLLDFSEVEADSLNVDALIVDCELVARAARDNPEELRELLRQMQAGTDDGVQRALEITNRLGLTEDIALRQGGGFLFLVVLGVALLAGGCGGALKQKASSASTTPKPPPPPPPPPP
jgi:hypothetical protein